MKTLWLFLKLPDFKFIFIHEDIVTLGLTGQLGIQD